MVRPAMASNPTIVSSYDEQCRWQSVGRPVYHVKLKRLHVSQELWKLCRIHCARKASRRLGCGYCIGATPIDSYKRQAVIILIEKGKQMRPVARDTTPTNRGDNDCSMSRFRSDYLQLWESYALRAPADHSTSTLTVK